MPSARQPSSAGWGPAGSKDPISFWDQVGHSFPSLKNAASTRYYFQCEKGLFVENFPELTGVRILKTDLWDEAKNSEILRWTQEAGAEAFGIDISPSIARQAAEVMAPRRRNLAVADLRALPFVDGSFDLIYSMGTIEHFDQYRQALAEIHRVTRPGGKAIIGVPNKLDPFLRPLMVFVLQKLGLYGYGREKSFTAAQLGRRIEAAGFAVEKLTGILFMPGWLRMAELWLRVRGSTLERLAAALVKPFAWLYRRYPALRRHGYLLVMIARKRSAGPG